MMINSCSLAKQHDLVMSDAGIQNVTYTDEECADQATIDANIGKVTLFAKIMTQSEADPYQLSLGYPLMQPYFTNRHTLGLLSTTT